MNTTQNTFKRPLIMLLVSMLCFSSFLFTGCSTIKNDITDKAVTESVSESESEAGADESIDNVLIFLSNAAEKTASANSLTFEVEGFGPSSDNTIVFMKKVTAYCINTPNGMMKQAIIGAQRSDETEITNENKLIYPGNYDPTEQLFSVPIDFLRNEGISRYLSYDTPVENVGNGIRCVTFMMTFSDFAYYSTGELDASDTSSKPILVKAYVDKNGYLTELSYDAAINLDGTGEVYTNYFRYTKIDQTALLDDFKASEAGKNEKVVSDFPEGKPNNSVTVEMLKEYVEYPSYTTEDIRKYAGITAGGAHGGTSVALKSDKTVYVEKNSVLHDEISAWTDIVYLESYDYGNVVFAIQSNGSVIVATNFDAEDIWWDLTEFTDIVSLCTTQETLFGVKKDGSVVATGRYATEVEGWSNVKVMSADGDSKPLIIALTNDGKVLVNGTYGTERAAEWTDIVHVSAGRMHVVGLKSDGTVVALGDNTISSEYNETAVEGWSDIVWVVADNMSTIGIKSDGSVIAIGYEVDRLNDWTDVVYISHDYPDCFGVRMDGSVYGYGWELWDLFQ